MTKSKQDYLTVASDPHLAETISKEAFLEKYGSAGQRFIDSIAREERQRVVEMIEELRKTKRFNSTDNDFSALSMQSGYLFALSDLKSKLGETI